MSRGLIEILPYVVIVAGVVGYSVTAALWPRTAAAALFGLLAAMGVGVAVDGVEDDRPWQLVVGILVAGFFGWAMLLVAPGGMGR